jgi:bifunctional DNA-binding transcriptional regulator/antitoxin component of YhaV-PrlF toxin-antitoxin module
MVKTHFHTVQKDRMYVYIPSFLRKDFNITKDSIVDITKEKGKIVITVSNAGDEK